jgi:hypothetical protein
MHPPKNEPGQESNRAIFARVKKVMDEPRMSESAREDEEKGEAENVAQRFRTSRTLWASGCIQRREKMAKLTTATRDRISATKFAFPKQRKEPLENASHVRNAAARFDQVKGVTEAERRAAWKRIQSAAKRFGVELNEAA